MDKLNKLLTGTAGIFLFKNGKKKQINEGRYDV